MAVKTVTGTALAPDGSARKNAFVVATLSQSCVITGTSEIVPSQVSTTTAVDGTFSLSLEATNDMTPNNTFYRVSIVARDGGSSNYTIQVPQTAGPFEISNITTSTPTASPTPSHVSTLTVDGQITAGASPNGGGNIVANSLTLVGAIGPYASDSRATQSSGIVAPVIDSILNEIYVDAYSGTDDQKMSAAFAAWAASSLGGTIKLPPRKLTLLNQYVTSYVAATPKYLKIQGSGFAANGQWGVVNAGSIIDAQWNGTGAAKFEFLHLGVVELCDFWLKDSAGDNKPFAIYTNAQPQVHNVGFSGSKSGTACDQDVHILGGQTTTIGGGDTAAFQGYGGRFRDTFYDGIRRGITWGTFANGVRVDNETYSITCGSSEARGAPYVFAPLATYGVTGNCIVGGTIEIQNYKYLVNFANDANMNMVVLPGIYDENGYTVGYCYFADAAQTVYNLVIAGFVLYDLQAKLMDGPGAGNNTLISSHRDGVSQLARGVTSYGTTAQRLPFMNHPASGQWNFKLATNDALANTWEVSPSSAADGTSYLNAGLRMDKNGHLFIAGTAPSSGSLGVNVTSITPVGTDQAGLLTIVIGGAGVAANTQLGIISFAGSFSVNAKVILLTDQTADTTTRKFTTAGAPGPYSFQVFCQQALAAGTYLVGYIVL